MAKEMRFAVLSVLAVSALVAENFLTFPLSVPYMKDLAGGAPILDMRLGYSPEAAYHLFDLLGEAGRKANLTLYWSVDLVLPALFGSFLAAAIGRGAFSRWRHVAVAAAAFDYVENIAITILLLQYPEHHPNGVYVAASVTVVKQLLYSAGLLLAATGALVQRRR